MLEQCSSNLVPEMYTTKKKCHLLYHCHVNGFAAGPVLTKTEIPSFCLNQVSSTCNNRLRRVQTKWASSMFQEGPCVPLQSVPNGDI